jgi:hypothetical protein
MLGKWNLRICRKSIRGSVENGKRIHEGARIFVEWRSSNVNEDGARQG